MESTATRCGTFLRIIYCFFDKKNVSLQYQSNTNLIY